MLWRRYDMLLIMFIKHWYLIKLKISDQQGLTNLLRHSISRTAVFFVCIDYNFFCVFTNPCELYIRKLENKYFILIIRLVLSSDKMVFEINLHVTFKTDEILLTNSIFIYIFYRQLLSST